MEKIRRSETVYIPRVAGLPAEASAEKKIFEEECTLALIVIPIAYRGNIVGFVGFDSVRTEKEWAEDIIKLLRIVGEIFINAIEHKKSEEALRESEKRYRGIFDNAIVGVFSSTIGGVFLSVNPAFARMFGYSSPDEVKREITDISTQIYADKDSRAKFIETIQRSQGKVATFEARYRRKDGSIFIGRLNAWIVYRQNKEVGRFEGFIEDATEMKKVEEALLRSEKRYRILFETMSQGVVYQDAEGKIISANPAAEQIMGLTLAEMQGRTSQDRIWHSLHEDGTPFPGEEHPAMIALHTGKELRNVIMGVFNPKKHQYRWISINAVPQFREGESNPYQVYTIFQDVTEAKKMIEALRESEEKYRSIFDNAVVGVFRTTIDGKLLSANPAFVRMMRFSSPEEMVRESTDIAHQFYVNPGDRDRLIQLMVESKGKIAAFETRYRRKDGTVFTGWLHSWVVYDKSGNISHLEGFIEDITARKEAEKALLESENKYRTIFENTGTATIIVEEDTTISLVNSEFERLTGYSRNEIEGKKKWPEFIEETDVNTAKRYHWMRRSTPGSVPVKYETRVVDRAGNIKSAMITADLIPGTKRSVISLLDITSRKVAEEQLARAREVAEQRARESEEGRRILEALMEQIPEGITIAEAPSTRIRMVNKYGQEMIGRPADTLEGITSEQQPAAWHYYHTDGITPAKPDELPLTRATRYGEVINNEEWVLQKSNGEMMMALINAGPIRDRDGRIMGGIVAWRDITERMQQQEKLKQSYEKLQRSIDGIINAIVKIVETRDPYTAGHEKRVAQLDCAIATEMGLSEERINSIRIAAVIHDIGKIYVPAEILSKPGNLSEMEFAIVKIHPQASYDILKVIEFPGPIAQIALQHQERYNGSGYPFGLKDGDILLEARILAVADVVEAMTFYRPYRSAVGIDKALEEIEKNRGILYDPDVVDACLRLFKENKFKFEKE
jgi:PAS domain S-box-containing protein